jgi:hypothetical protein
LRDDGDAAKFALLPFFDDTPDDEPAIITDVPENNAISEVAQCVADAEAANVDGGDSSDVWSTAKHGMSLELANEVELLIRRVDP